VRCTRGEYEEIRRRAGEAGMSLSEYLRCAAFNQRIVAKDAYSMIGELRKIGALIKHNYPSVKSWSGEERRRYWKSHEQLRELADAMACMIGLKKIAKELLK
jgi:hypothetical protein